MRKPLLKRTTLPKTIADHLIAEITSGHLTPGERLPTEKTLMKEFGVGRSSMREALQHLVLLGMVEAKPGFGYRIKTLDRHTFLGPDVIGALLAEDSLLDLLEAREIVEPPIAALAAGRATESELGEMKHLLDQMESRLARGRTVHRQAARFHFLIAQAAKNGTLERWIAGIVPLLTARGWQIEHDIPGRSHKELALHRKLYECIRAHDAAATQQAMLEHLADARATILREQERVSPRSAPRTSQRSRGVP
jgi:GntR family transcriptional regulator, transcriptional repressor for pyruvate dehydrogenase complex